MVLPSGFLATDSLELNANCGSNQSSKWLLWSDSSVGHYLWRLMLLVALCPWRWERSFLWYELIWSPYNSHHKTNRFGRVSLLPNSPFYLRIEKYILSNFPLKSIFLLSIVPEQWLDIGSGKITQQLYIYIVLRILSSSKNKIDIIKYLILRLQSIMLFNT
jgi:hypothetical protein